MLALSTSWIAERSFHPRELVQALEKARIGAVELEYRLTPHLLSGLKEALVEAGVTVTSVHNYCPHPGIIPGARPSGDYFRLSARDPEERNAAVRWTARTIETAHEMEARFVVLHCGSIEGGPDSRILMEALNDDREVLQQRLAQAAEQRRRTQAPFIEALLFSLDRLFPAAERYGVTLALENRFHYHELPGYDDFESIFKCFDGAPLGYWHDTGHAHAQQTLGIESQEAWLKRCAGHIKGFHLHDARRLEDHLPPGEGEVAWSAVRPYLEPGRPWVLELAPHTELAAVCRAAEFVRGLLSARHDAQPG